MKAKAPAAVFAGAFAPERRKGKDQLTEGLDA
jgi:hypothetical protein